MTERLYQTDAYLREFNAVVTRVDSHDAAVVLDQTAFYPGGGGQPNDVGVTNARVGTEGVQLDIDRHGKLAIDASLVARRR